MNKHSPTTNNAFSTLIELCCWRALEQPDQRVFTFLLDGETQKAGLTFKELDRQARTIAHLLQNAAPTGDRALLLYPPGLDYVTAFFGCLYAGVVAVPACPPDPARLNRTLPRLQAIVADSQASRILTTTPILSLAESLLDQAPNLRVLRWLTTDNLAGNLAEKWQDPGLSGDSLACLQYTSGLTAAPKGVALTHASLLHDSARIYQRFGHSPESRGVIWLPPDHDVGLVGGIIQPLYGGFPVTLMSPLDFLRRPLRWLQAISRYQATTSGGPNFAYDLCVRKITPQERAALDLSCWQLAFNVARPVRRETMERFAATFAACGFRREAFYPCYGLTGATLIANPTGSRQTVASSRADVAPPPPAAPPIRPEESFIHKALAAIAEPAARHALLVLHLREQIARILRRAPSQLDPQTSLAALGFDSLTTIELKNEIETGLGVSLPLADLLQVPDISQLAAQIAGRLADPQTDAPTPPIRPIPRRKDLPLSFAQQRLWFLNQLQPDNPAHNISVAARLKGRLDVAALAQSLRQIVKRHEALRTTFAAIDGRPVQVIAAAISAALPVADLESLPEAGREAETQRLIVAEARQPFDLSRGPLLRATLLRLDQESHVFLLTMHHIVSDGWSMSVFSRELAALYAAFSTAKPSPLPELPLQYADLAHWQQQWLTGSVLETQLAYWKQQLGDDLAPLALPTARPRPAIQTFRGAKQSLNLATDLTQALKALSRRAQSTLFMTLLAAFKTILHRYSAQDDIVVGSPVTGRNRAEAKDLIGFFLNTLVLRTDLSGDPTFIELLSRVRRAALDAYANQDVPFEKLLDELRPQRDLSRTPLFQVFFNMLNLPHRDVKLPGLTVEVLLPLEVGSLFDLTLYAEEQNQQIKLDLVYNADLFDPAQMAEMLAQLHHLLQQIVEQPQKSIARYSLITAAAAQFLPDPTATLDAAWQGPVHIRPARRAHSSPEHPAVVDKRGLWTYQQLEAHSNQLAHYLRAHGVRPQDIVAVYSHRSAALVWALLGILKAGAAFTILDPAYPASRLVDCLALAQPRGWLHIQAAGQLPAALQEYLARLSPPCRLELPPCAADASHLLRDFSTADAGVTVGPDDLACLTFTSGSTGKPKGILGRHGPLSHFLPWQSQTFDLNESDRYSMLSGLSHDPLQRDILTPLWLGATICVPDPEEMAIPGHLTEWMRREKISIAHLTPAMIQLLTQNAADGHTLDALRYTFIVGDALTRRDVSGLQQLAPAAACVNFYGATETQRAVGYFVIPPAKDRPPDPNPKQIVPLGRGIPDVQLLILNAGRRLAGIGEKGEIYVRSPHLARGYLGDEASTRERFAPNPFTSTASDRLYKTGDLGRYLPDGNVEFLGRADEQVKIRGFRIEPGEIEAALSQHPAVQQSAILAHHDTPAGKRLVAYVVPKPQQSPTVSELRRFLREKLPDYMLPAAFILLQRLPLTPNGKLDRRALPAPDSARPDLESAFVAPRTPVEKLLAAIWAKVLKREQIGVYDNFFDLGGDSILSLQIIARARRAGLQLTPRQLFQRQTIADLAQEAETGQGLAAGPIPLTPGQHRFFQQTQSAPHLHCHTLLLRAQRPLTPALLAEAARQLPIHHDALRLRFTPTPSGWQQFDAGPDQPPPLITFDLSAVAGPQQTTVIESAALQLQASLNLSAGPLLRLALFDPGAGRPTHLLLVAHPLVVDRHSQRILLQDLQTAYRQLDRGETITLPPPTTSYRRWAERLSQYARSADLQPEIDRWLAAPKQPGRRPPPAAAANRQTNTLASTQTATAWLDEKETQSLLHQATQAYRASTEEILLTTLAQTLGRRPETPGLLVELAAHERPSLFPDLDLSRTVGCFTTHFPIALDPTGATDEGEALKRIKEQRRSAPQQGISYSLLRYLAADGTVSAALNDLPQPQVSFDYLEPLDRAPSTDALFEIVQESSNAAPGAPDQPAHLLRVSSRITGERLRIDWQYNEQSHHRAAIIGLAKDFVAALRALIAHCQTVQAGSYTPADFPKMQFSQKELDELVAALGATIEQDEP